MLKSFQTIAIVTCFSLLQLNVSAQAERRYIREGNRHYEKKEFADAEIAFKKASEMQPEQYQVRNNMGAASFRQQKYEDASNSYSGYMLAARSGKEQSTAWYNLGTSLLQAGDYARSIDALQKAIILNPDNNDARYNLSVAQYMQAKQQSGGGSGGQGQNNNQQQQQQQQQNDKNQDKKNQQQQQQQDQVSKEDAERILNAMEQDEKDLQEKLQKEKARVQRVRVQKEW